MYFDGFPAEYLQAKLRLINSRISELPDVRVGKREGRDVLRQIKIINGKRIVREVSPNKQAGKDLLVRSEYRNKLLTVKRQIEASLKGVPVAGEIDVRKVNTLYDRKFWEQIHIRAEFEKKEKGYDYKGMILDSRAEMIVAQCLDSMGLAYKYEPRIIIGGEIYYPSYQDCPKFDLITMEGRVNKGRAVIYEIHLNPQKETKITFFYRMGDNTREIYTALGRFSHMPKTEGGYYARGGFIIRADEKQINVTPYTDELRDELEENYQSKLLSAGQDKAVEWRKKYFEAVKSKKKELWMISDRTYVAGDNGEHFFRYMNKWHHKGIETCFNIDKDSPDYKKMLRIGNVVPYGTDEYKLKFLLADKIISSSVSDYLFNPFGEIQKYLVDLIGYEFVFLQHGLTKDDLSSWLNRYNKNISLFVTSAIPEYLSIVNGDYCMSKDIPVIAGMPRFDALYKKNRHSRRSRKILIIPTWRQEIKGSYDPKESKSIYFEGFKETEYFKFYNSLINDERLLKVMKDRGCTGLLCMHPMHSEQWKDFDGNEVFKVNEGLVDYQKEFVSGALLLTDYSSVAFDFAYLHKPVIYTQFDKEEFYKKHTYNEGYFDYERDGFGPVCYDKDSAVKSIISAIENGFRCDEKYLKRVDEFYPYHDAHCCRRVYEAIRDLKLKYSTV